MNERMSKEIVDIINLVLQDDKNELKKIIKSKSMNLKEMGCNLSKMDQFRLVNSKLKKSLLLMTIVPLKENNKEINDVKKLTFTLLNYELLDNNIREICSLRDGKNYSADKSKNIISLYIRYALTGKIPKFDPTIEEYWIPKFGTHEEWIEYCDGIKEMYYGKTDIFMKAYKNLLNSEKRLYKHILHKWYIEFKDGEVVEFAQTWDNDTINPFNSEVLKRNGYYFINKDYLNSDIYEVDEEESSSLTVYCKVPTNDIARIYKSSGEVMI